MKRVLRKPLIDYIPIGFQNLGGWFFIGFLCMLSGLAFAVGIATSTAITTALHPVGLKIWGAFLAFSGGLLDVSIATNRPPLEKMSLHFLTITLTVYGAWILAAVPFTSTGITLWLILALVVLAQIRCLVLRRLLNRKPLNIEESE